MKMLRKLFIICFFAFTMVAIRTSPICPSPTTCAPGNESTAVCILDGDEGCIRKYPSKCHLDIAACLKGTHLKGYDNLYCSMESYICEVDQTYARWTIFFGHED